ncbi:MAG: hypothetical protein ACOC8F_00095 [Planctomycetota bacterium]
MMRNLILVSIAAAGVGSYLASPVARAQGVHLPEDRETSFTWQVNDAAGFRWDISNNAHVNDGTNDAYDGGMRLKVNGTFVGAWGSARLSEDGNEVEAGPWKHESLRVWRRVYVDRGKDAVGYCRWIDIFENVGKEARTVDVEYFSDMGNSVQHTYTTSGGTRPGKEDWGIVTSDTAGSSSRPAVVHVFASKGSRHIPQFTWESDDLHCRTTLEIPPGRTVALCMIEAQRGSFAAGKEFLDEFDVRRELRKVPPALRKLVVNMQGSLLAVGALEVPRHGDHDLLIPTSGDSVPGRVVNERFTVATPFGELTFPAERVMGIQSLGAASRVRVGLVDGQVVVGELTSGAVRFRPATGDQLTVPPADLATVGYRVSPDKPEEVRLAEPVIVLRSGARLGFSPADFPGAFLTEYGRLKLDADHLQSVELTGVDGGLHRAIFRNGTVLSGLLLDEQIDLPVKLGLSVRVGRGRVRRFVLPAEQIDKPCVELTLRNDDVLRGYIVDETLTVRTRYGRIDARPDKLKSLSLDPARGVGYVRLELHDGTSVSGRLVGRSIRFRVTPGPVLDVFVGHIQNISCPAEGLTGPPKPTSQPASHPAPDATTRPTTRPGRHALRLRRSRDTSVISVAAPREAGRSAAGAAEPHDR